MSAELNELYIRARAVVRAGRAVGMGPLGRDLGAAINALEDAIFDVDHDDGVEPPSPPPNGQ